MVSLMAVEFFLILNTNIVLSNTILMMYQTYIEVTNGLAIKEILKIIQLKGLE